jgi:5-methylcytosine-specific restriction endonuclease McrA
MVFVLDKSKRPLNPTSNGKASWLLDNGYATIHKTQPFTIRLKKKIQKPNLKKYIIKIDPGSQTTGLSINCGSEVVFLANLNHRANAIKKKLDQRRDHRRFRRAQLKYREKRFDNRDREKGWLLPSINSIVKNIKTWIQRLKDLCPIDKVVVEIVNFDTQKMQNSDIEGIEYQQGTLQGYTVKEYLLYQNNHICQYCVGYTDDPILEVEHKNPKSRGGTDSIKNLTLSCKTCNRDKDNRTLEEWVENLKAKDFRKKLYKLRYHNVKKILNNQEHINLKDAARVNAYKTKLIKELKYLSDTLEFSNGAKTKYNRNQIADLPKEHYFDALCIKTAEKNHNFDKGFKVLNIKATGRGRRQRVKIDRYGFPKDKPKVSSKEGFRTGDIVKAQVPEKYKYSGTYIGRVAIRASGNFRVDCFDGTSKASVPVRYITLLQRGDGYSYSFEEVA